MIKELNVRGAAGKTSVVEKRIKPKEKVQQRADLKRPDPFGRPHVTNRGTTGRVA